MKKYICTIIALALAATACQKSDGIEESVVGPGSNKLTALLNTTTRTMLVELGSDGKYANLWSEGDQIGVFVNGTGQASIYDLDEGAGSPTASFVGYGRGSSYVAVYPADAAKSIDGNSVTIDLPLTQSYAPASFGPGSFPMLASSTTTELAFKNLCAVLKLSIKGTGTVQSITFRANDESVIVAGGAAVDITDPAAPKLTMLGSGSNEVTLDCTGVGAVLNGDTPTDFLIVLPAQTYTGGFTVTVCTPSGNMQKRTSQEVVLHPSELFPMNVLDFAVNVGIEPSKALPGEGTANSPFLIRNIGDLLLMQTAVNTSYGKITSEDSGRQVTAYTASYRQVADIDMTPYNNAFGSWTPIGNYGSSSSFSFRGSFDGGGHSITNLFIEAEESKYSGLFGSIYGVTIKNLTVSGTVNTTGTITRYIGMVVGTMYDSTITGCETSGTISGGSGAYYLGGLAGFGAGSTISGCRNYADISKLCSGGIAGYITTSTITDCANHGAVNGNNYQSVGGIAGHSVDTNIFNCFNTGQISGWRQIGGIVGIDESSSGARIANCYNTGDVLSFGDTTGGITGNNTGATITNCVNAGRLAISTAGRTAYFGGICGTNSKTVENCYWLTTEGVDDGIQTDNGLSKSVFELNNAQIRGETSTGIALYTDAQGQYYTVLLDALNAWAADNTPPAGFYSGWQAGDACPVFTCEEAKKPDGSDENLMRSLIIHHTNRTFAVPQLSGPSVKATVDWGDGQTQTYDRTLIHSYSSVGSFTVTVSAEQVASFKLSGIKGVTKLELK